MNLGKTIRNLAFFVSLASSVYAQQKIVPALSNALILTDKEQNSLNEGNRIVVNIPSFRLYFCKDNEIVKEYPISIGRIGLQTPEGNFKIGRKLKNPGYYPVKTSIYRKKAKYFPPGEKNPMGTRAMNIYGHIWIHGLAEGKRTYIGKAKGGRCIGLLKEDMEELYPCVSTGTPVDVCYKINTIKNLGSKIEFDNLKDLYNGYRTIITSTDTIEDLTIATKKARVKSIDFELLKSTSPENWNLNDKELENILAITDENEN
jgi:lipoprotein-anchoring transpeptidase ErfK/SrfK